MGRSCALTGLNWKRSEPAILKAGGVGGGCWFPLCPPRPARDPGRPSAAVRPAAGRRPRARPHAASPRGARVSPPSVWPALRSVDSFTSRSHWPSVCPSLLSRAVPSVLSLYPLPLPSSFPSSSYPLPPISACFSFSLFFLCFVRSSFTRFPSARLAARRYPSFSLPLLRCFVRFPFPCFWSSRTRFSVLSAHFVADALAVAGFPPPLVLPQRSPQRAQRRAGRGAPPTARGPARAAGTRAAGVGPARRRAPRQAAYLSPAVLSALRDRRLWLGSEEPGQLLLIKSQLWFLSGEPLSKGTDTKLCGLARFLR